MLTDDFADFESVFADAVKLCGAEIHQQQSGQTPASGYAPLPRILDDLDVATWLREGGMQRKSFNEFLRTYLDYSVKLRHPKHIAHQVSVPDYPSALAALINGLTNNPMAIFEMGPAGAAVEFAIINWMLEHIGWRPQPLRVDTDSVGDHAAGVLTHGGSLANLTCFLAARARIAPDAWQSGTPDDLVVLVPPASHYSVARAIAILGLGTDAIVDLPANALGVVDPSRVPELLDELAAQGKRCMALMANACATATGLHDPLQALGELCEQRGIWFHVDGCHGASALLSPEYQGYLQGIEYADSVVREAHKMLQVQALCAAVLFRNAKSFEAAFHQDASYLAYDRDLDAYDSLPRAIECTKSSLGLKLFMNLAWRGEEVLGSYVTDRYKMTGHFWRVISQTDGFHCPYEPESNILCFGYGDDDSLYQPVRDALVQQGVAHITTALVAGRQWLRLTVMNPLTDEAVLLDVLDDIAAMVEQLKTSQISTTLW